MFRVVVPRLMCNPGYPEGYSPTSRMSGDSDTRRMMQNVNRNVERMMEDMYNDVWDSSSIFGSPDTVMTNNPSKFEMKLDVRNYAPEEIDVKLDGRNLEIRAKHEEKQDDHGYIAREFTRKVLLPEHVNADTLESVLTNDGCLVLKAEVKAVEQDKTRQIPIQRKEAIKQ